jgi:purine-binding chemotaxis protein CheW
MWRLATSIRWTTLASSATPIEQPSSADARRTLLFRVGDTIYGCDLEAVREIVPFRRPTRLPGAPKYVLGLINLRGTIVMVFDLAVRLEPSRSALADGSIMLVSVGGTTAGGLPRAVGFAVQEVLDVRVLGGDGGRGSNGDLVERSSLVLREDEGVVRGLIQIDADDGPREAEEGGDETRSEEAELPEVGGIAAVGSGTVILLDIHSLAKQVLLS